MMDQGNCVTTHEGNDLETCGKQYKWRDTYASKIKNFCSFEGYNFFSCDISCNLNLISKFLSEYGLDKCVERGLQIVYIETSIERMFDSFDRMGIPITGLARDNMYSHHSLLKKFMEEVSIDKRIPYIHFNKEDYGVKDNGSLFFHEDDLDSISEFVGVYEGISMDMEDIVRNKIKSLSRANISLLPSTIREYGKIMVDSVFK